jgi:hypothetical protein
MRDLQSKQKRQYEEEDYKQLEWDNNQGRVDIELRINLLVLLQSKLKTGSGLLPQ